MDMKLPLPVFVRLFFALGIGMLAGCEKPQISPEPEPLYAFYIAGHTYGHINVDNEGVHPPFEATFPFLNAHPTLELGIFTGDIVRKASEKDWDEVDEDVAMLEDPVHFAPGNHDVGNPTERALFEARYGDTYFRFVHQQDLFIILDPNLDGWDISGDQLAFLKNTLDTYQHQVDNIYVFFHQMLWWSPNNIFRLIRTNSLQGRKDSINFWSEVEPLFHDLPNQVLMCAGDVGAINGWLFDPYMYYQYDNMTFIASGMGNGVSDNIVIIEVMSDKSLRYRLYALNGDDPDALGKLEDYKLRG